MSEDIFRFLPQFLGCFFFGGEVELLKVVAFEILLILLVELSYFRCVSRGYSLSDDNSLVVNGV